MIIIPEPKSVVMRDGKFTFSPGMEVFLFGPADRSVRCAEILRDEIRTNSGMDLRVRDEQPKRGLHSIVIASEPPETPSAETKIGQEGYRLSIAPGRLVLSASDAAGLFYGVQTLIQMLDGGSASLPCCLVEDRPDLQIRGIHVNLWSMTPTCQYLEEFIKKLARYKINTILLEYEDKFPYEKHPVLRHPLALTREQIQSLLKVARDHHVTVIPLVQSIAHLVYVLKHKEYEHLIEKSEPAVNPWISRAWQYCSSNPASFRMFEEMAGEVMDLHTDSPFFHVGADEAYLLGQCKRCRQFVREHGRSRLFVEHMNKVGDFVTGRGKTPILWYDYLTNYPRDVDRLSKDYWIMYWEYRQGSRTAPFLRWAATAFSGRQLIDQVPDYVLETFRPYWDGGDFPDKLKGFPYIKFFHDRGFNVLGAARYQGDLKMRVPNTTAFCEALHEEGAKGMVNSHWPGNTAYPLFYGGAEPLEASWVAIAATAESAWSSGRITGREFDGKFAERFLGAGADDLLRSMYLMGGIINSDTADAVQRNSRRCLDLAGRVRKKGAADAVFLEHVEWAARVRAAQARRVRIVREIEDAVLRHIDQDAFSQNNVCDVPLWNGFLSPGSLPEGLAGTGVGLAQLDEAIEKLAGLRVEIGEIRDLTRTVLGLTLREEEVRAVLEKPLPFEDLVEKYLGQLQVVRTCLKVEEYFGENFARQREWQPEGDG